jgi:gluconolactonase
MKALRFGLPVLFLAAIYGYGISQGADGVVAPGAVMKKLAGGYTWAEGPAVDADGSLFFTDNRENLIHRLSPDGTAGVFLREARRANGLYPDVDGSLLVCTGTPSGLVRLDPANGTMTVLADSLDGKPLNSPNDLWRAPDGGIYFTDPYWGLETGRDRILYLSPDRRKLIIAARDMVKPNGIIGTPDGKLVYVSDWREKKTYVYTVNPDRTLSGKNLFAPEGDDGLAMDVDGNVYLSGNAVAVYSKEGAKIDSIAVPEIAANMCFGGKDKKTLYITARTSVYSIRTRIPGL